MNKKGFTIVELLATLAIMSIIMVIGTYSLTGLNKIIKEDIWKSKIKLIEKAGVKFGEDHKNLLIGDCTIDSKNVKCMEISVQTLINRGYLSTKEYIKNENVEYITDEEGNKIKTITNNTLESNDPDYYVNEFAVKIYEENNYIYAIFTAELLKL